MSVPTKTVLIDSGREMDARISDTGTYQHERKIQMNDRNQKACVANTGKDNFRKRISETDLNTRWCKFF